MRYVSSYKTFQFNVLTIAKDVVRSSMYVWTKFKDHEVQPEELVLSGKELLGEI